MDSLIAASDLVEKRIDLSWQAVDPADDLSTNQLPPNPENEAKQAKLEACQSWIKRLQEEDKARNLRINQYKSMTERITKRMTLLPPLPASSSTSSDPSSSSTTIIPDLLQPNWLLPIPRFNHKNDTLAYGKKLPQPKPSTASTRRKTAAAASNEESNTDSNIIKVQDEYPVDYEEIKHQAASMSQSSYRINQFLKLADTFVTQHLARIQIQLGQITGSSSSSLLALASTSSNGGAAKEKGTGSEEEAWSTTRALLAGNNGQGKTRGQDAMSLLRAISRADTTSKKK